MRKCCRSYLQLTILQAKRRCFFVCNGLIRVAADRNPKPQENRRDVKQRFTPSEWRTNLAANSVELTVVIGLSAIADVTMGALADPNARIAQLRCRPSL